MKQITINYLYQNKNDHKYGFLVSGELNRLPGANLCLVVPRKTQNTF